MFINNKDYISHNSYEIDETMYLIKDNLISIFFLDYVRMYNIKEMNMMIHKYNSRYRFVKLLQVCLWFYVVT